ncbi:glycosyltransferase family 2 protein [Hyphococcus flavus]|uniref:Glycosyltransferase family 2 protein n=1 Tax=Hyphococcus flavus TaxID=1866326 RepID=A0AAF0CIU8_9PROT|nr:glycosyltransferase family 2 protein [Hyphococcus flavus]WDI33237.1 glycosyltransferase family 2 protein [Hyphococcus flavus]
MVAPMHNEAGGAAQLVAEIAAALENTDHEIIIVDDASSDETLRELSEATDKFPQLRIIRHERNAGQSRALRSGVLAARGSVVVMLDGDGQNDPADIPLLFDKYDQTHAAMVAGERRARQDSSAKKLASRFANGVRRRLLRDGATDTGCGLKLFHRDAFLRLPYFDHMHRYLPALMRREGFEVVFVPVSHRARAHGKSKYSNLGRLMVAFRDILGVLWLLARAKSPGNVSEEPRK